MSEKQEWEELEKWYREKQEKSKERYGFNNSVLEEKKPLKENLRTTVYSISEMKNKIWIILVIICFILVGFIFSRIYLATHKTEEQKVIEMAKSLYQIDCKVIQTENLGENKDRYTLQRVDNPAIVFKCVKTKGGYAFDYTAHMHREYFKGWQGEKKSEFMEEEKTNEEGLLEYNTYISVTAEDFDNIGNKIRDISDFVKEAGENYSPYWNIYLEYKESRIYPYLGMPSQVDLEEAIEESKRTFMNLAMKKEPEKIKELYPLGLIDRYWKPENLTVILNGKEIYTANGYQVQMYYSSSKGCYLIQLYTELVKEIEDVNIISKAELMPTEFEYEGKKYQVNNQKTNLQENSLNYSLTIEEFKKLFHAEIKIDKQAEKVTITI